MIKKFTSGNPIDTQAVVEKFNALPIAEFPLGGKFENGKYICDFYELWGNEKYNRLPKKWALKTF